MKKMLIILLAVCLLGAAIVGVVAARSRAAVPNVAADKDRGEAVAPLAASDNAADAEAAPEPTPARTLHTVDLAAVKALHDPDEVVLRVDGQDVTWDEYFYLLASQVRYLDNYFAALSVYYGMDLDWTDVAEGDNVTYAQLPVESVMEGLGQFAAIERFAAENEVSLTEADLAEIEKVKAEDFAALNLDVPADADEETRHAAFVKALDSLYMSEAVYNYINEVRQLYASEFDQVYGPAGELLEEQVVLDYLNEKGYVALNHILLSTKDTATGAELDEAAAAEKKARAEAIAEELQAIEDPVELLKRFNALKEEFCEDTGKLRYAIGYTFIPGSLNKDFEDAGLALEEYKVSAPVKSDFGYHVILRLPLSADGLLAPADSPVTARETLANELYLKRMTELQESQTVEFAEGFTAPDLNEYLIVKE